MSHPDVVRAVMSVLETAGGLEAGDNLIAHYPADFYERLLDGGVVVGVMAMPGSPQTDEPWQRWTRVRVECSARGTSAARDLSEECHALLYPGPLYPPEGDLEEVRTVAQPTDTLFAHDDIAQWAAVYDIETKEL